MNTANKAAPAAINKELSDALVVANVQIHRLALLGVTVLAVRADSRRPVLVVDHMPPGVESVIKRRNPNGTGGAEVVRAAAWEYCQLEALHDGYVERVVQVMRDNVTRGTFRGMR